MMYGGHDNFSSERTHGLGYALIIGSHNDFIQAMDTRNHIPHTLNERLAANIKQGLSRQTGRPIASRNNSYSFHALPSFAN